jgi:predicted nucleic acid-binding protein
MKQGKVVDLSAEIALEAAKITHDREIPIADSIVVATALNWNVNIWTQDSDFEKLDGVKYFPKKNS